MTLQLPDDTWAQWLAEARRDVLYAAESYVYGLRNGWLTPEHTDRLIDTVDTLNELGHRWLADGVTSDANNTTALQTQGLTDPRSTRPSEGADNPCHGGHVEQHGRGAYLEGRPDAAEPEPVSFDNARGHRHSPKTQVEAGDHAAYPGPDASE